MLLTKPGSHPWRALAGHSLRPAAVSGEGPEERTAHKKGGRRKTAYMTDARNVGNPGGKLVSVTSVQWAVLSISWFAFSYSFPVQLLFLQSEGDEILLQRKMHNQAPLSH